MRRRLSSLVVAVFLVGSALLAPASAIAEPLPANQSDELSYFTGNYTPSLELYSFNLNLNASIKGGKGAPPITTIDAIKWAASVGFKAVDITSYYLPGYNTFTMPTVPTAQIMAYADQIKALTKQLGLRISGTGVFNDFADPNAARRALDVQRIEFWTEVAARMGAPVMRVFSGKVPADINTYGWADITQTRIVPALQQVTAFAATKGVKIVLQNHGDMTATADQTIQMLRWVDNPNISIIDDTGYFRPFQAPTGDSYDWYRDISQVLPYSKSIQVKQKPAGEGTTTPMDLPRLFTDMRLTDYRGFIPLEMLWVPTDPGYPKTLSTPPFDQITAFQQQVNTALAQTRTSPFVDLRTAIEEYASTGQLSGPVRQQLDDTVRDAADHFHSGQTKDAMARMRDFLARVANPGQHSHVGAAAQQALTQRMTDLLTSFTDVFGQ
ncbi:MAG TPA: sugar phosphate isomerase/epimerase family protein [Pseudonocardiaceae bacterium]